MSTVPVIAPDGSIGDVPAERLQDTLRAGGKPGVNVRAPDGTLGVVPSDRYVDAVKAGATVIPFGQGEPQQPGFLSTLWSDLKQMPGAMLSTAGAALTPPGGTLVPGQLPRTDNPIAQSLAQTVSNYQSRQQAGNTLRYRLGAAAAELTGTNVSGMESAATQGNPAGVLGHAAAVPTAMMIAARAPAVVRGAIDARAAFRAEMTGPEATPATAPAATPAAEPPSVTPEPSDFGAQPAVSSPLHGESALSGLLSRLDNATLLKIAKSRGISVTKLQQLKPGVANAQLVQQIVSDFSPDELADISSQVLENTRFQHSFGDISDEAWRTMTLQSHFPDLKIPVAQLKRTAASIAGGKK